MDSYSEYTILVGVDGSSPSKAAIRWAVQHAKLTDGVVRALIAWEYPAFARWESDFLSPEEFAEPAREVLAVTVESTVEASDRKLVVRQDVVHEHSARALLDAAEHADLLVLGSHRRRGRFRMRHGSVSRVCVRRSQCSVVLVRR